MRKQAGHLPGDNVVQGIGEALTIAGDGTSSAEEILNTWADAIDVLFKAEIKDSKGVENFIFNKGNENVGWETLKVQRVHNKRPKGSG